MNGIVKICIVLFCSIILYSCAQMVPERKVKIVELNKIERAYIDDPYRLRTVRIGPKQAFKTLNEFLDEKEEINNVHLLFDKGNFYTSSILISGKNIILEGSKGTRFLCEEMHENVLWVSAENVIIKNIQMQHFAPGDIESQNCSGRVLAFDHASNVLIENCDLNGCGLAGLHDNLGNSNILIKNNFIHNNSVGAYTDIDGNVWQEEIDDHPVFKFENNKIKNNGRTRSPEVNLPTKYIIDAGAADIERVEDRISVKQKQFKGLSSPFPANYSGVILDENGYFNIFFEDPDKEVVYNFGAGDNEYSGYRLFDEELVTDPKSDGQRFSVFWEWKVSTFTCCYGERYQVKAYMPSITRLELMEE